MMPKLLLADDSITVQRVIALTFQGEGIEVIAVGDGDLAVDAIDRERPHIVLADLSMPGRDGYAVAEYVKRSPELSKDIRVVLLTGAAEPVEEARSRALGIDGVLSKPFEPHVATALVRRLLDAAPTVPGQGGAGDESGASEQAGDAPPPLPAPAAAPASSADHAIAVDDYFRRLDEALATAGLGTAPESAADLAAIASPPRPAGRSNDAETVAIPRPTLVPAPADASGDDADGPKLVDAFSALLDAEEGRSAAFVAAPVEIDGAPDPVPPPAVEWKSGAAGAVPTEAASAEPTPVESAPETVALRAGAADAAGSADATAAVGDAVAPAGAEAAAVAADAAVVVDATASASPAALRADAPHPATEGIDLDVFADAVAQKILHRLTDARIDAIVSERVLEIAERLVREEIERIKADVQ
jgi:CheY-like chemotaxis protein